MVNVKQFFSNGNGKDEDDFDVEKTLASLSTVSFADLCISTQLTPLYWLQTEKVALLGGKDFWHTADFPSKGIPAVRMSDGPNGVRGIK